MILGGHIGPPLQGFDFYLNNLPRVCVGDLKIELLDIEAEPDLGNAAFDFQDQASERVGFALHGFEIVFTQIEHFAEINDTGLGFE